MEPHIEFAYVSRDASSVASSAFRIRSSHHYPGLRFQYLNDISEKIR